MLMVAAGAMSQDVGTALIIRQNTVINRIVNTIHWWDNCYSALLPCPLLKALTVGFAEKAIMLYCPYLALSISKSE